MTSTLERIETRLREVICPRCARYTSQKSCSLPPGRPCAIFRSLPEVIDIVRRTHNWRIDPYADTLRLRVCAECPHENDHGCCPIRESLDCALDSYFPLVVDEIESELRRIQSAPTESTVRDSF